MSPSGEVVVRRGIHRWPSVFNSHSRVVVVRRFLALSQLRAAGLCDRKIYDVVTGLGFDPMTFCILGGTLTPSS